MSLLVGLRVPERSDPPWLQLTILLPLQATSAERFPRHALNLGTPSSPPGQIALASLLMDSHLSPHSSPSPGCSRCLLRLPCMCTYVHCDSSEQLWACALVLFLTGGSVWTRVITLRASASFMSRKPKPQEDKHFSSFSWC